jgi:MFS family permease
MALGLAVSAFFYAGGMMAAPLGRVSDRIGWPRSFQVGALVTVISLLGAAFLARSWLSLTVWLIVGGLGYTLVMPASNIALSSEFGPRRQGLLFGAKGSASSLVTMLAGGAVPALALTLGWRWAFAAGCALPVLACLLARGSRLPPPHGARAPARASRGRVRAFWVLAVASACGGAVITSLGTFLVVALVDGGMGLAAAAGLLSTGSLLAVVAKLAAGWISDRRGEVEFGLVSLLLLAGALGFGLLAVGTGWLVVVGAIIAFVAGTSWSGILHLAVVQRAAGRPGSSSGIVQTGLSVGAATGPFAFGAVSTSSSYAAAWLTTSACAAVAAMLMLVAGSRLESGLVPRLHGSFAEAD